MNFPPLARRQVFLTGAPTREEARTSPLGTSLSIFISELTQRMLRMRRRCPLRLQTAAVRLHETRGGVLTGRGDGPFFLIRARAIVVGDRGRGACRSGTVAAIAAGGTTARRTGAMASPTRVASSTTCRGVASAVGTSLELRAPCHLGALDGLFGIEEAGRSVREAPVGGILASVGGGILGSASAIPARLVAPCL